MIDGVLYAAVSAFRLVLTSMAGSSSPALIALAALALVVFPLVDIFVTLCFAVGLTGLHAFLGRRSVLGISGLVMAYLSIVATVSSIVASFYVSYRASANPDPEFDPSGVVFAVGLTQALLLAGGILLVGVAALSTRTLGWWRFLPLVLGLLSMVTVLLTLLGASLGWPVAPGVTVRETLVVLQGLLWVLLGGMLLSRASPQEPRTVRSTA